MASLRLQSKGFTQNSSRFRGVTRHAKGKWEARIGQMVVRSAALPIPPPPPPPFPQTTAPFPPTVILTLSCWNRQGAGTPCAGLPLYISAAAVYISSQRTHIDMCMRVGLRDSAEGAKGNSCDFRALG